MAETVPPFINFPGQASPLGVSEVDNAINFAIFSQHATAVTLCLSLPERGELDSLDGEMVELALDPNVNKTGDIWHICIESDITWHEDNWDNFDGFMTAVETMSIWHSMLMTIFVKAQIPSSPPNRHWFRVAATNLASPDDFVPERVFGISSTYNIAPYSSILPEAK